MGWEPQPGDVAHPKHTTHGSYAVVLESNDDTVKFRYVPAKGDAHEQTVRLSTFLSRYEFTTRLGATTPS